MSSTVDDRTKSDISVQKADGILNQLETWYKTNNNYNSGNNTSNDNLVGSDANENKNDNNNLSNCNNNELAVLSSGSVKCIATFPRTFKSLPLDIIDQIDATSV